MRKKLKLNDFKVNSFVTDISESHANTLKAGALPPQQTGKKCWERDTEQVLCSRYGGGCNTEGDCAAAPIDWL